jgi:hypothetical protein
MIVFALVYTAAAVFTAWVNLEIIVGRVQYPWAIGRNALLWPIFLPIMVGVVIWAVRNER